MMQVVEFVKSEDYARFTRIVFDTAPTGHTLRLLTVPDFVEASLGKLIRLRKKLTAAGDAVRGLFGVTNPGRSHSEAGESEGTQYASLVSCTLDGTNP